jgi:hypothetical protein
MVAATERAADSDDVLWAIVPAFGAGNDVVEL